MLKYNIPLSIIYLNNFEFGNLGQNNFLINNYFNF